MSVLVHHEMGVNGRGDRVAVAVGSGVHNGRRAAMGSWVRAVWLRFEAVWLLIKVDPNEHWRDTVPPKCLSTKWSRLPISNVSEQQCSMACRCMYYVCMYVLYACIGCMYLNMFACTVFMYCTVFLCTVRMDGCTVFMYGKYCM